MPSSSDQTRVGRTLILGGGAESSLEGRDIELSVSPKDIRTSPYDLCANRSNRRQSREGDRWFESSSLQRRVHCELAWTRWAHIREFLMQEWWSYLTRCAQQHRNDAQRGEAGHDPSGIGEPAKLHYQQSRHQWPEAGYHPPRAVAERVIPTYPAMIDRISP